MKTLALRLYGKNDLRLEAFELTEMREDEILADITSDSICMSTHKAMLQGASHKRVPNDVHENPIIVGHEFCGTILKVGKKWQGAFNVGQKYGIQPALNVPGREMEAPGYSFREIGGNATHILIPREVMEQNCLLPYEGDAFFKASLSEPVSCVIGAFKTQFHHKPGEYTHQNGIVPGGRSIVLAGTGPMGLGAIDYALHGPVQPGLLVVTGTNQGRLDRAAALFTVEEARRCGVDLRYVNTGNVLSADDLKALTQGKGFDDVFVFAPVREMIEQGSRLLGYNGCLNFFAGPASSDFPATINFYDVHYSQHHYVGSSGGNADDMREALTLISKNQINPAVMITHIGGLDAAAETIRDLPKLAGAKKLIYNPISMPLTAIDDFEALGKTDPMFKALAQICAKSQGLWSPEAENYLLANAKKIEGVMKN